MLIFPVGQFLQLFLEAKIYGSISETRFNSNLNAPHNFPYIVSQPNADSHL